MNEPQIQCYSCKHALKRGDFRECAVGGTGYKHIGEKIVCNLFERSEDDKVKVRGFDASAQTLVDVFGGVGNWVNFTALEAICKIAAYEERQNRIEVGDEAKINADGIKAVVMDKSDNEDMWWLYTENGCIEEWQDVQFRKSGRTFPQIE